MRRFFAAFMLSAGLLCGSAALAQSTEIPTRFSVTKLSSDASSNYVLTVEGSILRESAPPASLVSQWLNAAALLYRLHRGDDTGWNVVTLTPGADLRQAGSGTVRDPWRWVKTFTATLPADNALVKALLAGEATYEWYVSSTAVGGANPISDFQDLGRKMNFDDITLWTPARDALGRPASDLAALGDYAEAYLTALGGGVAENSWHIVNGSVGTNSVSGSGDLGAQLLNVADVGENYVTAARIESPVYPDGVSAVVFEAKATKADEGGVPLLLQYQRNVQTAWTTIPLSADNTAVAETAGGGTAEFVASSAYPGAVALGDTFLRYTVTVPAGLMPANADARFRLVRAAYQNIASEFACETTCVIRNLRVRSAAPTATVTAPTFQVVGKTAAEPSALDAVRVDFRLSGISANPAPTGYTGTLKVSRRGDDLNATVIERTAAVTEGSGGAVTLSTMFEARALEYSAEGLPNVTDSAFFTESGRVVGLLPQVYNLSLELGVQGSFLAGRTVLDERETVVTSYSGYAADSAARPTPYTLDLRENRTRQRSVSVLVSVLDRTGSDPVFGTLEFPCEPVSKKDAPDTWRVLLPKTLSDPDFDGLTYAWGLNQTDSDGSLVADTETADSSVIAIKVRASVRQADGTYADTYYGCTTTANPSAAPEPVSLVQAVRKTMAKAAAASGVTAYGIAADSVALSGALAEIDLSDDVSPSVTLTSAAEQDFNTWVAMSDDFEESTYSDSMVYAEADFDAVTGLDSATGDYEVLGGWYPDEGPFAGDNALEDSFEVGRDGVGEDSALYYPGTASVAGNYFASWGGSHAVGQPYYLLEDGTSYDFRTENMALGPGAELLLARNTSVNNQNKWRPDALVRLRSNTTMGPNYGADAKVTLNGVGEVSFSMALSLPYSIFDRIALYPMNEQTNPLGIARGVQTRLRFPTLPDGRLSGYSVSLYLVSQTASSASNAIYELRLTQISDFSASDAQRPGNQVVAEFYQWTTSGASPVATRLPLGSGAYYHTSANALSGATVAFWIGADGKLRAGFNFNSTSDVANAAVTSLNSVVSNVATANLAVALGSAECRPAFDSLRYLTAASDTVGTGAWKPFNAQQTLPVGANQSAWSAADAGDGTLTVSRNRPSADAAGVLLVEAVDNGLVISRKRVSTVDRKTFSVTLGATNVQLRLTPEAGSNVLIDDIRVTSWCGDDTRRNGAYVPEYTDAGFPNISTTNTGFAAVGAWVTPKNAAELSGTQAGYSGDQVMLLQYSRRNESCGRETVLDGIRTTGHGLAVYMPYTNQNYGAVNLRYMIPATNPVTGLQNPEVQVVLQYAVSTSYVTDFLGTPGGAVGSWLTASEVKTLPVTNGEWRTASIIPSKIPDNPDRPFSGYLRLVMVTTNRGDSDPLVYLDQIFVTQKTADDASVWYATNAKLTSTPADLLYWKDREPNSSQTRETPFAERTRLTPAMQFNDRSTADGSDAGTAFAVTALDSPRLGKGVGTVTFAARRLEAASAPVRVYLAVSTDDESVERSRRTYKPVTYVEVRGEIWQAFTVDMTAYETYLDGATPFSYDDARYLRLTVGQSDNAGAVPDVDDSADYAGRILIDRVTVADPVTPTVDVESIDFVNSEDTEFDARYSPLSQPVHGAPAVRVRVTLQPYDTDRIDPESVKIYLSYRVSAPGNGELTRHTSAYSYTDVLGNTVSASADAPVYAWNVPADWPLSVWLKPDSGFDPGSTALDAAVPGAVTVELTREGGSGSLVYVGTLGTELSDAAVNSLVRYGAWASYKTLEDDGVTAKLRQPRVMTSASYREFPWYFPRSLNAEIRTAYNAALSEGTAAAGAEFFSPYFWVYDSVPGEVFLNEINIRDGSAVPNAVRERAFVEICAPAETSVGGWRLGMTAATTTDLSVDRAIPTSTETAEGKLPVPDPGVVPVRMTTGTSSDRAFHTVFAGGPAFYHTAAGTTEQSATVGASANAGIGTETTDFSLLDRATAANSVLLYRPTGGAEHIVVYSNGDGGSKVATLAAEVTKLTGYYRTAYQSNGFDCDPNSDSPWSQTFASGNWATQLAADMPANVPDWGAKATGARLVSVIQTPTAVSADSTDVADYVFDFAGGATDSAYANSISTLDMGTVWTQTDNAVNAKTALGPTDLTELFQSTWPGHNPTQQARNDDMAQTIKVTPRQVNVGQYMLAYEGIRQIGVTSELDGFGSHLLTVGADGSTDIRYGGMKKKTWSVPETTTEISLTYTPVVYHSLTALTVTFVDRETRDPVTERAVVEALLQPAVDAGFVIQSVDANGLVTLTLPGNSTGAVKVPFRVAYTPAGAPEATTYNPTFTATFALSSDADGGITSVRAYCGDGDELPGFAKYQPWWGSAFGFEVAYREEEGAAAAARPTGVLVVFPKDKAALPAVWDTGNPSFAWAGLDTMRGMTLDEALAWLGDGTAGGAAVGAAYVRIDGAADGRIASANAMPILGRAYEDAEPTAEPTEPAVPYIVWGIYTDTAVNDLGGTDSVTFVLPQRLDGSTFEKPDWYRGPNYTLNSNGIPYFHLYSAPPQSAWVSEIDLDGTDGNGAFVEVAMPKIRQALIDAGVPETAPGAWKVGFYGADGTETQTLSLADATETASGSSSYAYHVLKPAAMTALTEPTAAVLLRPSGISEGGVWTKYDAAVSGNVLVPVPDGAAAWLAPAGNETDVEGNVTRYGSYIYPGVADGAAGSVQLVGQTVADVNGILCLTSDASRRDTWSYLTATEGSDNDGGTLPPETPGWNQVTLVSRMVNTAAGFASSECGYWINGLFTSASAGELGSKVYRETRAGADWVYGNGGFALSYRNRQGYVFESISLPQDMIGRVILIGSTERIASTEALQQLVNSYLQAAAADETVKKGMWLTMNGLCTVNADTGMITFDTGRVIDPIEGTTFADLENFYVTLVIAEEPISAVSEIRVSMTRGTLVPGLWLYTQSFFGLDPDTGLPDDAKGGDVASDPIWTDDGGTAAGAHKDVHGWVYQPIVGDELGMSAVIVPEEGLTANVSISAEDLRSRLTANANEATSVRPFLVWNLIPATKVSTETGSDAAADFFMTWSSEEWLGRDPRTLTLTALRRQLRAVASGLSGAYTQAGIVPMVYDGSKSDPDTDREALFFRTMTPDEFAAATADAAVTATGLIVPGEGEDPSTDVVDFARSIEMTNAVGSRDWADGAVLRFAIVVADAVTGQIYDWQSVSNFESENMPAYCPWYLPAATADLNTIAKERGRGTSPYIWVYEVPQGVAWINEFRPFRASTDTRAAPAFELAMRRSPLTAGYPDWSLTGWELVLEKAPLPALMLPYLPDAGSDPAKAELAEALEWREVGTVGLYGWVPASRLGYTVPADPEQDTWGGLEFYPIAADTAGLNAVDGIAWIPYRDAADGDGTLNTFNYLPVDESAFAEQEPTGIYAGGVIYALSLRRNNGVVEDRVLFYTDPVAYSESLGGSEEYWNWYVRMLAATAAENRSLSSVSLVRGIVGQPATESDGIATAQFLRSENAGGTYDLYWAVNPNGNGIVTLPGPNMLDVNFHAQPNSSYEPAVLTRYYTLGAQLQGAAARLAMTLNGAESADGGSGMVVGTALSGSSYMLNVSGWDNAWYRYGGTTCNGEAVAATPATTYVSGGLNTLSQAETLTFSGSLEENTEYVISFCYTDAARSLADAGVLDGSADDGFLKWLMQVAPEAVVAAQQDGVTAAEKYWIGLGSAVVDASDVELSVRAVDFDTAASTDGSAALSTFAFAFTRGGEPITALQGDGRLVLLGKAALDEPWTFVRALDPAAFQDGVYVIDTDLRFFKAVLISAGDADALK